MRMISKIVAATLLVATTASALTYENSTLYKDVRFLGMGNANVAVGGESASLFHNPAGLLGMKRNEGLEFEILNVQAMISDSTIEFTSELLTLLEQAQSSGDQNLSIYDAFVTKYIGKPVSLSVSDYTSIAYRGSNWALSVGVLGSVYLNAQVHNILSSEGILEVNGFTAVGTVAGFGMSFLDHSLHVGLGTKVLMGEMEGISFNNVINANIGAEASSSTAENYYAGYTSVVFDAGVMYDLDGLLPFGEFLRPTIGASLLNIGGIKMGTIKGEEVGIPMTANVGFSLSPAFGVTNWFLTDLVLAVDYVDALGAYETSNVGKNLRMGGKFSVIKGWLGELTASAGMYNMDYTAGMQLRLLFLELDASTYAEELGAYAGQQLDRRYQIAVNIGW
ncbi:MAG: hypothetical protein KU28_00210 [Sulfurovum sp. PC08-66]|nr:MAG: hypothetical protein KU28_00210 [Sulfurovum sp. PC08-66]KIM12394.1 MAG: hypothetical protein KU37_00330 [Sulfuricurvum sp. PC08-66]